MKRLFLGFVMLSASCRSPLDPAAQPFAAPAIYRQWFAELEVCSGRTGDFDAIRWYTLDHVVVEGIERGGYWRETGNIIVLRADRVGVEFNVKHEEMHALLQMKTHPAEFFLGACGILM